MFGAQPWESNLENTCRKVFPQGVCVLPHVCETKLPVTRRNCSGKGRSDDSDFVKVGQRKESCSPSLGFEGWVCSNGKKDGQNQIIVLRIIYAVRCTDVNSLQIRMYIYWKEEKEKSF